MADYSLTSASVAFSSAAVFIPVTLGATIAGAGQTLYRDTADLDSKGNGKVKLFDANAASPAFVLAGISTGAGVAGQPGWMCVSDPVYTHGLAAVTKGDLIIGSATAGGLAPSGDLASGWYGNVVMAAISSTTAVLGPFLINTAAK